ncbi:hypothetical protein [Halorussus marinus]|uniref:hypothetical protein n=1 Tax=Halorussus marinus TaxID=2505976 RepID=UPI00109247EE|nr:hypothetical protein [Halorussus marinus]
MTVRESASDLVEPRTIVLIADYDEHLDAAFCPLCGTDVTSTIGTPTVPAGLLEAHVDDDLPVYGWRCECRRVEVVLPAPVEVAPDHFASVDAQSNGETVSITTPEPALNAALAEVA